MFLRHFVTFLIEAVGGYKDFEQAPDNREGLEKSWEDDEEDQGSSQGESANEDGDLKDEKATAAADDEFNEGEIFAFDDGRYGF